MTPTLLPAALALLALAEPPPPAAAEVVPAAPPGANIGLASDYDDPPQGTPEELQLWRDGVTATRRITEVRTESFNLRISIKAASHFERLAALKAKAGHEEAERLSTLFRRYQKAFDDNVDVYKRQWPIDVYRGCGYFHLYYDSALRLAPGRTRQAEVENAREPLRSCVATANMASDRMASSTRRLAAVKPKVEAVLAGAPAGEQEHEEDEERHERQEKGKAGKKREHGHSGG